MSPLSQQWPAALGAPSVLISQVDSSVSLSNSSHLTMNYEVHLLFLGGGGDGGGMHSQSLF